jgi:hypothetical protein
MKFGLGDAITDLKVDVGHTFGDEVSHNGSVAELGCQMNACGTWENNSAFNRNRRI